MAAEVIGRCRCPLCKSDRARMSLSKSKLPVITCNACQSQTFTRSDVSDMHARALLIDAAAAPAPEPAPAAEKPAPAPQQITEPPAEPRKGTGWGVLG